MRAAARALFGGLPLFFMVLSIAFGTAFIFYGGWRMLHGLPVCGR
jgi:hypothetical protein